MYSLIFTADHAQDLASVGIEYLTFDNNPAIVEVIESADHPLIDGLIEQAQTAYRIN